MNRATFVRRLGAGVMACAMLGFDRFVPKLGEPDGLLFVLEEAPPIPVDPDIQGLMRDVLVKQVQLNAHRQGALLDLYEEMGSQPIEGVNFVFSTDPAHRRGIVAS